MDILAGYFSKVTSVVITLAHLSQEGGSNDIEPRSAGAQGLVRAESHSPSSRFQNQDLTGHFY